MSSALENYLPFIDYLFIYLLLTNLHEIVIFFENIMNLLILMGTYNNLFNYLLVYIL